MNQEKRAMSAAHKRQAFVMEYCSNGFDPRAAAVAAGYAAKSAHVRGSELLRRPEIARAIDERLAARGKARELDAQQVIETLWELVRGCMVQIPVKDDDGQTVGFKPCNASSAARGLELLGRTIGLYVDRREVETVSEIELVYAPPIPSAGDDDDEDASSWRSESVAPGPRLVDSGAPVFELEAAVAADGAACSASTSSGRESAGPEAIEKRQCHGIVFP